MEPRIRLVWNRRNNNLVEVETYYGRNYRTYASTGIKCSQWDPARRKALGPGSEEINRRLAAFTVPDRKARRPLMEWLEQEQARRQLRPGTLARERVVFGAVREFGGAKTLADVTPQWLSRWDTWLHDGRRQQATVHNYHKVLKVYMQRAEYQGLIERTPYARFKTDRGKTAERHALTAAQLSALEALDLKGELAKTRDLFVLMAHTGLAHTDALLMDPGKIRDGWYAGERVKTGVHFVAPVDGKVQEILQRYGDVPNLSNQHLNRCLKVLGSAIDTGFPLTSHVARHTFITLALEKGLAPNVVQRMAGHSSITMTESYTHLGDGWVMAEGKRLLEDELPERPEQEQKDRPQEPRKGV